LLAFATTSSTEDVTSTNVGYRHDKDPRPSRKKGLLPPPVLPPKTRQASKASKLHKVLVFAFVITFSTEDLVGHRRRLLAGTTTSGLGERRKPCLHRESFLRRCDRPEMKTPSHVPSSSKNAADFKGHVDDIRSPSYLCVDYASRIRVQSSRRKMQQAPAKLDRRHDRVMHKVLAFVTTPATKDMTGSKCWV
jgi:hypothetical protein